MINGMSLRMLHHIRRRTGVVAFLESGSGYIASLLGFVIPYSSSALNTHTHTHIGKTAKVEVLCNYDVIYACDY